MLLLPLFVLTILLSAALLFAVQPMVAKQVLPLLGGSSAVWTTCMLFFQTLLLAGYAYAHLAARWLGTRAQAIVHLAVVCLPLAILPLSIRADWTPPTEHNPVFWLLALLTVSIGGPFFALSATTPLLQRWFAQTSHRSARDPYFLYAASNLGSMAALFAYPFLIEPELGLTVQAEFWSWGYVILATALAACAFTVLRTGTSAAVPATDDSLSSPSNGTEATNTIPSNRLRLQWLALSFIPSSWMLGVTTTLSTDFFPIPLFWIVPLALYLLTFILAFAQRLRPAHKVMLKLFPPAVLLLALMTMFHGLISLMLMHLGGLFVAGMVCHGELVRRRPRAENLTEFYLWLSIGGMLGGLLNAVIAPLLFSYLFEFPLTIVAACVLLGVIQRNAEGPPGIVAKGITTLMIATICVTMIPLESSDDSSIWSLLQFDIVSYAIPTALVFYWMNRPLLFTIAVAAPLLTSALRLMPDVEVVHRERSFFGLHQVIRDADENFKLKHGAIYHGWQNRRPGEECRPKAYYDKNGPLGDVFQTLGGAYADRPLAFVGLGAGAAICYQRPGQEAVIYEIDPAVVRIAEDPRLFTYLKNCRSADYRVVVGDGRLKLAEAEDGSYGVIVLDAFTADSVPTHLLTREAMRLYLRKLTNDGIIVLHISNNFLNLESVVADLATDARCVCVTGTDTRDSETMQKGTLASKWMVVARNGERLRRLTDLPRWKESTHAGSGRLWTDDYSSLIGILRLRWK